MPPHLREAGLITTVAFLWLLVLSSWLGTGGRGSALQRDDVFFRSDTGNWLRRVVGPTPRTLPNYEIGAHPAALWIWRMPARLLARAVALSGVEMNPVALAGRALVALVSAAGIGSLVLVATSFGITGARLWLLFGLNLLSTASVIVALPEYFGLSHGLLSMFFAAYVRISAGRWRQGVLVALGLLIAGTTITNLVLPLLAGVRSWITSRPLRLLASAALVVSGPASLLLLALIPASAFPANQAAEFGRDVAVYGRTFTKWRVTARPAVLLEEVLFSAVYPVVGSPAALELAPRANAVRFRLYQLLHQYTIVGIVAVLGWVALLVASTVKAAESSGRAHLNLLTAWIAFNLIFHSVWGEELFLYSPHWSWALFSVVLLGAGQLPLGFVAATCLATAAGQIQMLVAWKHVASIISLTFT